MIIDFQELSETKRYTTMSNTIFPRPIAWISTEDSGVVNLAPYSYFAPISTTPPLVIVAIGKKEDGEHKDSYVNILKHKRCTINLAHRELLAALQNTAEALPKEVSESEQFGIEMREVLEGYPPMVADGKCALFCEFVRTVEVGGKYEPVLLEIKSVYLDDEAVDAKGRIKLENIGRVGMEFLVDALRVRP